METWSLHCSVDLSSQKQLIKQTFQCCIYFLHYDELSVNGVSQKKKIFDSAANGQFFLNVSIVLGNVCVDHTNLCAGPQRYKKMTVLSKLNRMRQNTHIL